MEELKFTVNLPPRSKKNSQQIFMNKRTNRPFITQSAQYKEYEEEAMQFIPKGIKIDEPCNVKCLFYMPTKRKCDLTNLEAAIHDIMVKAGLLADDNRDIVAGTDGSRVYHDKTAPRTEVTITPIENYKRWKEANK